MEARDEAREPETAEATVGAGPGAERGESGPITALAALPPDSIIDEAALAGIFGKCTASIRRATARGEFPPPVRIFGKRSWTAQALRDHLAARLAEAARERETLARKVARMRP